MAPNLLGSTALFLSETTTNENVDDNSNVQLRTKHVTNGDYVSQTSTNIAATTSNAVTINKQKLTNRPDYEWKIVWRNVIAFVYLHVGAIYGIYLIFTTATWATNVWAILYSYLAGMGITAGAHRLWAHRAYKAKLPLRILLCMFQTMAFQNHLYEWVRDHRVHHKFTDTDADPHNSNRGFFFSHMGWLMIKKHPDVMIKGKTVDMSDMENDPVIVWQKRLYLVLMPILCFFFPAFVPYYFWNEDPHVSWYVAAIARYTLSLNGTWLVNSAAHIWGTKPYDKTISPTNNIHVAVLAFGEGWHNYHHVFPWDYKAAELGNYRTNFTTAFIDFFAKIGWAYDLKTVPVSLVKKRLQRTGDGTHMNALNNIENKPQEQEDNQETIHSHHNHHHMENQIWGWGDKDMEEEEMKDAEIINPDTETN